VWGAIVSTGKIYIEAYEGNMTAEKYTEMLQNRVFPVLRDSMDNNFILQQDGARAYTAKAVTEMLEQEGVETLAWLARSPDLNPVENVWHLLKNKVYKRVPNTLNELEDYILDEWDRLEDATVESLASSFPSRLGEAIEVEREVTHY
jgi:transposase